MMIRFTWILFLVFVACATRPKVDLVIRGGTIYTLNEANPVVDVVAVVADSIVYAGKLAGLNEFDTTTANMVNLHGATMTPGFIESHGHLMGLGYSEIDLYLDQVKSYDELVEKVKQAVSHSQPGEWIVGRGWHQDKWNKKPAKMIKGFQTHQLLSEVSPNNPVYLEHVSGHAGFANARAMQLAGVNPLSIEKLSKDLGEGGEVIRDELGNPTGIFIERATSLIKRFVPNASGEMDARALNKALAALLKMRALKLYENYLCKMMLEPS